MEKPRLISAHTHRGACTDRPAHNGHADVAAGLQFFDEAVQTLQISLMRYGLL
jgi:hypothetical protein